MTLLSALPAAPPIRILLAEDERLTGLAVAALVRGLGYEPLGPAVTAEAALALAAAGPLPDLALLDINLAGALDGVDLARELALLGPVPVVFLTSLAHEATFIRARAVRPAAYLLKPFDAAALGNALALALHNFAAQRTAAAPGSAEAADADDVALLPDPGRPLLMRESLFLRERGRLTKVCIEDILYVEAGEKYCTLITPAGKFAARLTLHELAQELPPARFVQTHRSYLVNADRIEHLDPADSYLTVGGQRVPLSRAYREPLLRQLRLIG